MSQLNNPLEIYKLLPKSNCRQCQIPTCLAFAVAVIQGQKDLADCPHLESNIIERFEGKIDKRMTSEQQQEQFLKQMKREIATIDFSSSAERLGASLLGEKLKIKCLGKNFFVDPHGNISSDCHINAWVTIPLLDYILSCSGNNITGEWVPFRELKNGNTWNVLFEPGCEKPFKQLADNHTDLFEKILYVFGGRPATDNFSSDISLVLHPLPNIPILISYYKPEDDLDSKLNIFFDATAEDNLHIRSIFLLGIGLLTMFQKIAVRHS
ncbi:MAG TPA: Fe-S cluster protein [Candidatus Margulisbacteria bacterium]|nr:Fe-S cluster protein [Candidatus Margulisiibacteriota bacterium]